MAQDKRDFTPPASAKNARGFRLVITESTYFFLSGDEAEVPETIKLDPRWRVYTNLLVDPAARFIKEADWACEGLPCSAERILKARERLAEIDSAQHAAQQQADHLERVAVHYRNQLTEWTALVAATADAKQADPTVAKARKDEIRDAAAPLTSILAHYNEAQAAASRTTVELRQQSDDAALALQRKDLEIRALRGDRLGPADLQPPPPAPRRGRRGRR
jgi:hypothetical protein